jgi:hypothetical protein
MIAIAVVASLVAYAWVMGFMGNKTTQVGKAIQIQSFGQGEDGNLVVYVQNVGEGQVQFDTSGAVYVNDALQTLPGDTVKADAGQTAQLNLNYQWTPGDTIKIKVVTTDGTFSQVTGSGISGTGGGGSGGGTQYTVNFVAGTGGTVTPSTPQTVNPGDSISITATPTTGYTFSQWTTTGSITFDSATSASTTAHINGAGTITANFAAQPVTVTRSASDGSGSWDNENNAYADGGNYARSNSNNEASTFSSYGFTIPSGATVSQVRVRLDAWNSYNDDIRLEVYDGSWHTYTPNPITLSSTQTTIWCDVTSLSTGGWTPSEVNGIQVRVTHIVESMSEDIYLDWIPIEVTYTP